MKKTLFLLLLLGAGFFLISCNSGSSSGSSNSQNKGPVHLLGEEIAFESFKPLEFQGGVIVDPLDTVIPPGTTLKIERIKEISGKLPVEFKSAGSIVKITFSNTEFFDDGIELRISVDDDIDINVSDLYYYDEGKGKWIRQDAKFTQGFFVAIVKKFSTYGVLTDSTNGYLSVNRMLEEAAIEYDLPPMLLKAIAFQESEWDHYWRTGDARGKTGAVKINFEPDGRHGVGIMQVTVDPNDSRYQRLKEDIEYNINEGARILQEKWKESQNYPTVAPDDDRYILENWWYATVMYNGWGTLAEKYVADVINLVHSPPPKLRAYTYPFGWTSPLTVNQDFVLGMIFSAMDDNKFVFVENEEKVEYEGDIHYWKDHIPDSKQPILKAPWTGVKRITQGNHGTVSHYDHGSWDNVWALDIASEEPGINSFFPVLAPADGKVVHVDESVAKAGGRQIAVEHIGPTGNVFTTVYLHLNQIKVGEGQYVRQGEIIAQSGDTGNVSGPHLHFHIWSGEGSYDSHTIPIERLIMRQVSVEEDFREYNAEKMDLHNIVTAGKKFESPFKSQKDIPSPPTGLSPGGRDGQFLMIETLSPILSWDESAFANFYALGIRDIDSNIIVYNPQELYGNIVKVPDGLLEPGRRYRWNMQAGNIHGLSEVSETLYFQIENEKSSDDPLDLVDPIVPAGEPKNLTASIGSNQISLSWDAVEGATGYSLYYGKYDNIHPSHGDSYDEWLQLGDVLAYTIAGLENGTTYYFVATAIGAGVESSPSDVVSAMPKEPASGEDITNSIGMTFNYIEPGTFMMGSPEDEPGRYSNETQHQVTLTEGYYMQTTPVTQGQWVAVMGDNPSWFFNCGNNCPVEGVSWYCVQDFIEALNVLEGTDRYALPTEAQWEYAARADSTTAFANGQITHIGSGYDPVLDSMGWYWYNSHADHSPRSDGKGTHPVAQKKPNAWGLYDMHGNVWEWVADWYGTYPYSAVKNPTGPSSSTTRVVRGGSWYNITRACRSANRNYCSPGVRSYDQGFRLVLLPGN